MEGHKTLPERIGQLITVGFHGTTPEDPGVRRILKQIESGEIGGVILFRYNIESREQLRRLTAALKSAARLPLLIMADQEGGRVQRINAGNGFCNTPSARAVSTECSATEARVKYRELAAALNDAGINMNLAPCIDLDCEPPAPAIGKLDRSYSTDPKIVAEFATAMIQAHRSAGILTCLKHFPGHGRAGGDTHTDLIDITESWSDEELTPYQELISAGLADAVMSAHLIHRQVDPDMPATLSHRWLQRLRKTMQFDGVIVPDDLHMGAILQRFSLEQLVVGGLNAGLDILSFSNNPLAAKAQGIRHDQDSSVAADSGVPDPDLPQKILGIATAALSAGSLTPATVDAAYERVARLKRKLAG